MTPVLSSRETSLNVPTHSPALPDRSNCRPCPCICSFLGHPERSYRYYRNIPPSEQSVCQRILYILHRSLYHTEEEPKASSDVIGLAKKPPETPDVNHQEIRDENYSLFLLGLALDKYNGFEEILSEFRGKTANYYRQDHDPDPKKNRAIQIENYKEALTNLVRVLQDSPFVQNCKSLAFDKIHGQTSTPFTSLTILPEVIRLFTSLESLNVSNNLLSSLPQSLAKLPISQLDLHNNRFESLPDVLFSMENLRVLDLSKNPLKPFTSRLSNLKTLEELYLDDTQQSLLDSIPAYMPKLSKVFIVGPKGQDLDFSSFKQKYPFFSIIYHQNNLVELSQEKIRSKL